MTKQSKGATPTTTTSNDLFNRKVEKVTKEGKKAVSRKLDEGVRSVTSYLKEWREDEQTRSAFMAWLRMEYKGETLTNEEQKAVEQTDHFKMTEDIRKNGQQPNHALAFILFAADTKAALRLIKYLNTEKEMQAVEERKAEGKASLMTGTKFSTYVERALKTPHTWNGRIAHALNARIDTLNLWGVKSDEGERYEALKAATATFAPISTKEAVTMFLSEGK